MNPATHRPWPLPDRPWVMRMRWCDLLFAHWAVHPAVLRQLIPKGMAIDLFNGQAYVGVVPFLMENLSPRLLPSVPGLDAFPELNLRTYVTVNGKPGVWFFSLDAGQKLAVRIARTLFHLPYFDATFQIRRLANDEYHYHSRRAHTNAAFTAQYRPTGPIYQSQPGTLDAWLTERYCLYAANAHGRIYCGEIDHQQWPLQPAEAEIETNTLGEAFGIELVGPPATLHFAKSLDVHAWLLERA